MMYRAEEDRYVKFLLMIDNCFGRLSEFPNEELNNNLESTRL